MDAAEKAAIAHVEYTVYKEALKSYDQVVTKANFGKPAKQAIKKMIQLYGLSVMEDNLGFFLQEKYVAPGKSKAISQQINALCWSIRPEAVALVDSFDIPDLFLPPIAKGTWVEHNKF